MNTPSHVADHHALEARLAAQLASVLMAKTESLPHDLTERLRFAREQALARARESRLALPAAASLATVSSRGVITLAGPWWQRAASVAPLVVLVAGLLMIDQWATRERVLAAADVDTLLLADDLPPAAYSDPGFAEYLRSAPTP
jgi:hypothetical protein